MSKPTQDPAEYIAPLNMNGLQGRVLHMPAPAKIVGKKRNILLIYGHHSSLERWFGLAQVLNHYGDVTMPDLPGFGGMESFYKIGRRPSIDALADYMAAFIKMRYKNRRITIVGMSLGFTIITRMLQRFPELASQVDLLVSLVGFANKKDLIFPKWLHWSYIAISHLFNGRVGAKIFRELLLHPVVLRTVYGKTPNAKHKFKELSPEDHKKMMEIEIGLWRDNDVRTYMYTSRQILQHENSKVKIDLPVYHVGVMQDHFFDNESVERHMRQMYKDFTIMKINISKHAPTVIADENEAAPFLPAKLRKLLAGK